MARIPQLPEESASPEFQETFRRIRENGHRILNLYTTMAHSPQVGYHFMRLGNAILMRGALAPPLRELAILRVGHLCGAVYEWTQHVPIALRVGIRQAQIDSLPDWRQSVEFNETERAILQFVDEETLHIRVTEETFSAVRSILTEGEIVELTAAIGYYGMVCRILETLGVELE